MHQSDRAGKMGTALLDMCMAPAWPHSTKKMKKRGDTIKCLLTSEVGPDGKIFGSPSGCMGLAALSLYVLTSSQIFSRLTLPLSQ